MNSMKSRAELNQKGVEEILQQYIMGEGTFGSLAPTMSQVGFTLGKTLTFDPNQCIQYLKRAFLILVFESFELRIYKKSDGVWEPLTEELLGMILMHVLNKAYENSWRRHYEQDVYDGLLRNAEHAQEKKVAAHFLAVENGVCQIKTGQFFPHNPKYLFKCKSSVVFQAEAECPTFLKTIGEIFEQDQDLILLVQEIFGYCLLSSCKAERAFIWLGDGANGKSLLADVLIAIVGPSNTSHIQLANLSERFGMEAMIGKKLNVAAENESKTEINTEAIKAIVSGDVLNITRKFKTDLSVRQTTKLVFLMNNLPDTFDLSHGFYRKIIIVPFPHVFTEEEMDKERKAKLLKEKSGILNWSMQGAKRLLEREYRFTEATAVEQAMKSYQQEQNPVAVFYKEELRHQLGKRIHRKELLDYYRKWMEQNGISARGTDSPQKFWKLLNHAAIMTGAKELIYSTVKGAKVLKDYWLPNGPAKTSSGKRTS